MKRNFLGRTRLVTLLLACVSMLSGVTLVQGSYSSEEVYSSMMQTALDIGQHPQVQH